MAEPIHVLELTVHAVVDPDADPYGQPGCSAVYAVVEVTESQTVELLKRAKDQSSTVTLKCARLEVDGRVSEIDNGGPRTKATVSADDVRYVVPPVPERRGLHRPER